MEGRERRRNDGRQKIGGGMDDRERKKRAGRQRGKEGLKEGEE